MITLIAATTKDGFIADNHGNGNFSSAEDKEHLRAILRHSCDGFICGTKTANEFGAILNYKPMHVFTRKTPIDWVNMSEEFDLALLGGAQTYAWFLANGLVDNAIITTEQNIKFGAGLGLGFDKYSKQFKLKDKIELSPNTIVRYYEKIRARV
ncbi:MAG: hypothetical protein FWG18_02755 [Alphaproteobacteria bacterium]|nr:hypothetical protein [Alphaproteobacteria bacterium]